jgi:hypothetical protein
MYLRQAGGSEAGVEIVMSSDVGPEADGDQTAAADEEKNDEKMALQSIYEAAFSEKIPGT